MTTLDIDETPSPPNRRGDGSNRRRGFSNDPENWLRKNFTVTNAILLVVALFQAGNVWERNQNTSANLGDKLNAVEVRLLAVEVAANAESIANSQTYSRRDVIEERLRAMEGRLANIELALSIRSPRR